jgi:hypothetical protein
VRAFLTQFFTIPWAGAAILTLIGILIYFLSRYIFNKTGMNGVLFSLIPLFLISALQSNHNYPLSLTLGWFFSLAFLAAHICIRNARTRYIFSLVSFVFLYVAAGFFSIITIVLCILYELFNTKDFRKYYFSASAIVLSMAVPYVSWKYLFLMPLYQSWLSPVSFSAVAPVRVFFYVTVVYFPLVMLITFAVKIIGKPSLNFT